MLQERKVPRSVRIFHNKNVWIALLKIVLPQVLIAFMTGLYTFVDQILMNKLIPDDGVHTNGMIFGQNYEQVRDIWRILCDQTHKTADLETASDIVHNANAISMPVLMILTSVALWFSMGASIMYSAYIGKKDTLKAHKTWISSIFPFFVASVILSIILGASSHTWLYHTSGASNSDQLAFLGKSINWEGIRAQYFNTYGHWVEPEQILRNFYQTFHNTIAEYAFQFTLPIIIGNFLSVFIMTASFCLNSEGKQGVVLGISIVCNLLNILVDFLFIQYAQWGMLSGGLGVCISYIVNVSSLITYLVILNKKETTLMTLHIFKKIDIDWMIFISILSSGFSSFLRNISIALAALIYQSLLLTLPSLHNTPPTYWLNFSGAVMPIYNLLFATSLGIMRGMRMMFAYHLGSGNIEYVKKTYWIGLLYSIIIGLVWFGIVANDPVGTFLMHDLFGIDISNPTTHSDAMIYLRFVVSNIALFGLMSSGMIFFQVSGRMLFASLTAILSGVGYAVIIFFVNHAIAVANNDPYVFICSWLINSAVAGLTIFLFTVVYMKIKVKPGYTINHPSEKLVAWVKKVFKLNKKQQLNS